MMEDHLDKECPRMEVKCPFHVVGCTFEGLRPAVREHVLEQLTSHMKDSKAFATLGAAQAAASETAKNPLRCARGGMDACPQEQASGEGYLKDLATLCHEQQNEIDEMRRLVTALSSTVQQLERRLEEARVRHERPMQELALRYGASEGGQDREEFLSNEKFLSRDGLLLWKIDKVSRQRNKAVSGQQEYFSSPSFYTSRYGYKMRARIYLNGDGMGRGTHISVFLALMRGEHDALLPWPFRPQKVTVKLICQDDVEHVIDTFRPDPNSSSFQRPRRGMNIVCSFPMFCPLTELNNHAYVRDDSMFIKIVVDTADPERPVSHQELESRLNEAVAVLQAQMDDLNLKILRQEETNETERQRTLEAQRLECMLIESQIHALQRQFEELLRLVQGRAPQEGQEEDQ